MTDTEFVIAERVGPYRIFNAADAPHRERGVMQLVCGNSHSMQVMLLHATIDRDGRLIEVQAVLAPLHQRLAQCEQLEAALHAHVADEIAFAALPADVQALARRVLLQDAVGRCCIDAYVLGWDECTDEYQAPSVPSNHDIAARIAESRDDDDDAS